MSNNTGTLGLKTAFSMVVGTVIGSGIFITASNVVAAAPRSYWPLTIWLVAGIISFFGALIFTELGTLFPKSGGQYVYLFESFGPLTAYVYGWTLIAVIQTGAIAAEASVFSLFTTALLGSHAPGPKLMAGALVVGFTGINMLGLKKAATALDILSYLKLAALLLIPLSVLFFVKGPLQILSSVPDGNPLSHVTASAFGVGLIAAFWAYDGWNSLGYIAGDVKNPQRNLPLATMGGITVVILAYLAVNWSYERILNPHDIAISTNIAADVMKKAFGKWGGLAISIAVILTTMGTTNAFIIAGSRIIQAMAQRGGLPKFLGKNSVKTDSPNNAFCLQMFWSLILLASGKFDELFTCVIAVSFLFYGLTALGLLVLRRKKMTKSKGYFKVPALIPAFYVLFCLFFMINTILEKPKESLVGLALVLLGIPAFYLTKARQKGSEDFAF